LIYEAETGSQPASVAADGVSTVVVGVGASAGGLKALQRFVEAIPVDSGMAYVVILHLDPDRESRMAELLQDRTSIPVTQITGPTPVEPNHVYVISPKVDMELRGATIVVRERGERAERVPIDLFFRTLSEVAGPDAIGVVLSGTGSDGTAGIRFIRAAGGITVVQSPDEADYGGMPTSAIATGHVDMVLPAARIPAELLRLRQRPSSEREEAAEGKNGKGAADVEAELTPIFAALRTRTGHDFSLYKRSTVLRRLDRRLLFNGVGSLTEYLPLLRTNAGECDALRRDLLISVSSFFRDPEEFEALAEAMPGVFEGKTSKDTVRVWVVGCATGEEVYSIGMVLMEHAADLDDPPRVKMFATDIDEKGYGWGREGLYPAAAVARVTPSRLERFFTKEQDGYRIAKSLRERVLFALHDVLRDPPFGRMDLISCRNLFIYLQPEAQRRVLETFHYALSPGGILFLGAAESAGDGTLFDARGEHRIYRRNALTRRGLPQLSTSDPLPWSARAVLATNGDKRETFSYGALHLHMLEQYAAPSVIVDERWEVVHLSEHAGPFLQMGEGEPSRRLLDLVRADLRTALRTAVHQAFELGLPTTRLVRMEGDGTRPDVNVKVRPTAGGDASRPDKFVLIVFEELPRKAAADPGSVHPAAPTQDLADLEEQLRRTRAQLESARADYDRSVAELQTVNEELLSINEEQKAAVEELETGREEIQAINEELTTINQEHQSTIEQLKRTNDDLANLIESTAIGTIFVDRELRIRRFTPPMAAVFNFAGSDHGRPLGDITHRLDYPDLMGDITSVLATLERTEREVPSSGGEWFIVRINSYRSHDGQPDGAVLTFFDYTVQHRLEEELRESKIVAEDANAAKGTFLSTLSHELRTPLSAMMGYADILHIGGSLNDEQVKRVERIKEGGRHLTAMIEQLLDFSRLDSNRMAVEHQTVDARSIVIDVHSLMRPLAETKGLAFRVELPESLLEVTTDVVKARQVLMNLCANAVKYTAAGEICLRTGAEENRVVWDVIDTGCGIAGEHHVRIFERFWQLDSSSTRVDNGLGIGLAAAREYARLLGGDVEVASEIGKGSTFRFWLPRQAQTLGRGMTP
jgi:two-component system CheB/CheR fusion protein